MTIQVRPVTPADADGWLEMREALWPGDREEHRGAIARFFAGHRHEPKEVLIAVNSAGEGVGFVELSIRNIVDSCTTDRVGYLEGWYVDAEARRSGIGRSLIAAAEAWARQQGCTEFASDSVIDNAESLDAHGALGFEATGRVVNFRKSL